MSKSSQFKFAVLALTALLTGGTINPVFAGSDTAAGTPAGPRSLPIASGDWGVTCRDIADKGKSRRICTVLQRQTNHKGQMMFAMELQAQGDGGTGIMLLPFGVAVTQGVKLSVDTKAVGGTRPFSTCLQAGCLVPLQLDNDGLRRLESGKQLTVSVIAMPDRKFDIHVPLKGFSKAWKKSRDLVKNR